jgi:hypothetical protein
MNKTYAIRLNLVGEIFLLDANGDASELDVAAIRKDFGPLVETVCDSSELRAKTPCNSVFVANTFDVLRGSMIDMLHVARRMELGGLRGNVIAPAVKNEVLSGGLLGDVASKVIQQVNEMGLTVNSPLVDLSKFN